VKIHRIILGLDDPLIKVDHKDGNGLNNMRSNLRIANESQNGANRRKEPSGIRSSFFKGVSWCPKTRAWRAGIQKNKQTIHLGSFNNERHAARAYNFAATALFGRFAKLNEIW
jgi:hypothetical protein